MARCPPLVGLKQECTAPGNVSSDVPACTGATQERVSRQLLQGCADWGGKSAWRNQNRPELPQKTQVIPNDVYLFKRSWKANEMTEVHLLL